MEVTINGREYEWKSDYDIGWTFSSGDEYKFPVIVGDKHSCFIKRFARNPERVSGWRLVQALRATKEPGLPRIHDIVQTEEDDSRVRYLFYECMEGGTLDDLIKKGWTPDPVRLMGDLFKAFESMHRHEHWMSDFCEKNIFCKVDDAYCLIDLDSAHPTATRPDNEMYGNKEYWALALSYLSQQARIRDVIPGDIPGPILNYLEIAFLILRIRVGLVEKVEEYKSTELRDKLPGLLDVAVPEFRDLFVGLVKSGVSVPPDADIKRIKELLVERVVNGRPAPVPEPPGEAPVPDPVVLSTGLPIIQSFSCDRKRLWRGGAFTLSWEVSGEKTVTICRNGLPYKTAATGSGAMTLMERYDGKEKKVLYSLVVANDGGAVNSHPLPIHVGPIRMKPWLISAAGVVGLVLLILGVVKLVHMNWQPSAKLDPKPVTKLPVDSIRHVRVLSPAELLKWKEDSLNRVRDSLRRSQLRDVLPVVIKPKPEPKKPKSEIAVPRVIHDTVYQISRAEQEARLREEAERERRRSRQAIQRRVMVDSVRVMDTVLSKRTMVLFKSGQRILGIDNRSGFFLDTVVVEITPARGEPYRKEFYRVRAKAFSVLMKDLPKEGVKASLVSVIF